MRCAGAWLLPAPPASPAAATLRSFLPLFSEKHPPPLPANASMQCSSMEAPTATSWAGLTHRLQRRRMLVVVYLAVLLLALLPAQTRGRSPVDPAAPFGWGQQQPPTKWR